MNEFQVLPNKPVTSPSRKFLLMIHVNKDEGGEYWIFEISDLGGNVLFTSSDRFYTRHVTIIMWDNDDRVWVYSGDLGIFIWYFDNSASAWQKTDFTTTQFSPPDLINKKIFRNKRTI